MRKYLTLLFTPLLLIVAVSQGQDVPSKLAHGILENTDESEFLSVLLTSSTSGKSIQSVYSSASLLSEHSYQEEAFSLITPRLSELLIDKFSEDEMSYLVELQSEGQSKKLLVTKVIALAAASDVEVGKIYAGYFVERSNDLIRSRTQQAKQTAP